MDSALGELRLLPDQFWRLTPYEFDAMRRGHDRRTVHAWQHTRWIGALLVNINRGENDPAVSPEELLPLPGDEQYGPGAAPVKTAAEKAEQKQRILDRLAQNNPETVLSPAP